MLSNIPIELIATICRRLYPVDILNLSETCSRLSSIIQLFGTSNHEESTQRFFYKYTLFDIVIWTWPKLNYKFIAGVHWMDYGNFKQQYYRITTKAVGDSIVIHLMNMDLDAYIYASKNVSKYIVIKSCYNSPIVFKSDRYVPINKMIEYYMAHNHTMDRPLTRVIDSCQNVFDKVFITNPRVMGETAREYQLRVLHSKKVVALLTRPSEHRQKIYNV